MNNLFFTSDHHFGHKNIITFCNRPFETVEEMNEELIKRWNEKIGVNDEVYHLGDFALSSTPEFQQIMERLNGIKYLIVGNHDGTALNNRKYFNWIKEYHELKVNDVEHPNGVQRIILFHYAMRVWRGDYRGTWHLYGHSHNSLPDKEDRLSLDIGVDCHDFYPLSYQEVKEIMRKKAWKSPFETERL
ncbi:MAG: hypothetical protein RI894_440 [Bacteroidota bacterium]|jgi:calcineurin-like phosphoesterase family protein